ncbi:hypothetical protein KP509_15G035600 [Ceratopteris richardii]|uniref:EF-hand domain-containing protein n=1 Tax=Ceratopteris richardii TaxID=49495 RepID=A0A8T2T8F9_CERRI|nr:hypothetical protein KP509_15G035600 [Ceratopteris richardii]KAH7404633.1 hypothetical protein KP509_15G035600 [Ceratopteris richardii]KAH7404634.1 hypothetical protein KP509_15G035600 [Ceratopteris richardii]
MDANGSDSLRVQKVRKIFQRFDANEDGGLNREEMAALVMAVNPRVKFSEEQIGAILDEVFRTYSSFIVSDWGLSFDGLLRTYNDGAGDVDRDFDALGLELGDADVVGRMPGSSSSITDERERNDAVRQSLRKQNAAPWTASPNNGITYDSTWRLVEDLEIIIKRLEAKYTSQQSRLIVGGGDGHTNGTSEPAWPKDIDHANASIASSDDATRKHWADLGKDYVTFSRELREIQLRADRLANPDEVFDAHMGIGRTLSDHSLHVEALSFFKKASDTKPGDARAYFRLGNTLYLLGRHSEARYCFVSALDSAEMSQNQYDYLIPHIHVNLGVALEADGMLLSASEHYKEAAIRDSKHYRALKLLGGALFGVGEYRAAEKALTEAIFLNDDYADAHCDLGSTLHALGDDERAIHEFQKAIDLQPDHKDALYNLGSLFMDMGRFQRAAEMYSKVVTLQPNHWRAQLNKAVALFGAGEGEEVRKAFKDALKLNNRIELYDAFRHLKRMERKKTISSRKVDKSPPHAGGLAEGEGAFVIEASRFKQANEKTTPRQWLTSALDIRHFQRQTRLNHCDVNDLKREFSEWQLSLTRSDDGATDKSVRKEELEKILRNLLHHTKPDVFHDAMKAINIRLLKALDKASSGKVDAGMFFALIAPICAGSQDSRKQAAFDALVWRSSEETGAIAISKADAFLYFSWLRAVYLTTVEASFILEVRDSHSEARISFTEFAEMFDDPDWGFGILSVLMKLEINDRIRHGRKVCAVCSCPLAGLWFKEVSSDFNLCSDCYSEGKVPASMNKTDYSFKEYSSRSIASTDKLISKSRTEDARGKHWRCLGRVL